MIVRPPRDADDEQIYEIARLAFGGPREPRPASLWSKQKGWHGLVAELDGRLVGVLKVREYAQFFGGAAVPMGGLASVAVAPAGRGRGVATALIDAVLPEMRDRGQAISALYPSVPALYRGRGWEQTGNYERVTLRPELFAMLPKPTERVVMRHATEADTAAIHECYLRFARTVDGTLDRSTAAFEPERMLELDIVEVATAEDGTVLGYLTGERPEGDTLVVHDLVADDRETALGLFANLGRWTGILTEVSLRINDPAWWQLLMTLPVVHDVRNHGWMLRVVDLPAAVGARGWPNAACLAPTSVDIEVVDEHAPWHAGRHRLTVDGGRVSCEPGGDGTVRLRARALGPWFAGSADTAMLRRGGLLDGDAAAARLLDQLTGAPRLPRMADSF
ncbi:GNAT family N-acetyltransferase [Actinophytocola oryzae]|uniref:Putative acetyltransferase n=1 Tax=Actinophytocola oryzae TaxID=502181 RepID=A0A4R7V8X5_9PSEU|nr:GNAT family N-acetyltransferase [Actinophytocola oryzae]TDV45366.1 putative acetyltransferase [Actinophytocola oryzae]